MAGLLSLLLLINQSFAADRPSWTYKTPPEALGKLYFVGRSPVVESESEGVKIASKDAKEQLLRREFGTLLKLDSSQKETLETVRYESTLKELSERVILKGWTQEEVFSLEKKKGIEVFVLYSVPRQSITSEQERLEKGKTDKQSVFNKEAGKIFIGMTRSEVLEQFGEPSRISDLSGLSRTALALHYMDKDFCEPKGGIKVCSVFFNKFNQRVSSFSGFLPEFIEQNPPSEDEIKKKLAPNEKVRVGISKEELINLVGKPTASYDGVNMPKASFWGGKGEVLKFEGDMCRSESMYDSTYEMGNFSYSAKECGIGIYEGKIKYIKNFDANFIEN